MCNLSAKHHLWCGDIMSTCKSRNYFVEIRSRGAFVYNNLSTNKENPRVIVDNSRVCYVGMLWL